MKTKFILFVVIALMLSSSVLAIPLLEIEKSVEKNVVVAELGNPAVFDLTINNSGEDDVFIIYTLVGVTIEPSESFELAKGEEKTIKIFAYPNRNVLEGRKGLLSFEYQIKGRNSGILKDLLQIEIVGLDEAVQITSEPLNIKDTVAVLFIENKEDVLLGNLSVELESQFFTWGDIITLRPLEKKRVEINLDRDKFEGVKAGSFIVTAGLALENIEDSEAETEGIIEFVEEEDVTFDESSEGIILRKVISKKTNTGNVPTTVRIEVKKDIISRLFTSNSVEPTSVERNGFIVTYSWSDELAPGESLVVETTTNYTFPFILVILVIVVGVIVGIYSQKAVLLNKSVSFVRTKGGEFALKVKIHVKARKSVDKMQLSDSLPAMTTIYEKFGKKPDKIEAHSRRLFWNIGSMSKGESQVYSYIIYSKVNVIGRFELPVARASYELDGQTDSAVSNRAFFAAEKG